MVRGNKNGVGDLRMRFMRMPCLGAAADRLHAHPHTPCTQKHSRQAPKLAALPKPGESLCTATEPAAPEQPRAAVCMPPSSTPAAGDPKAHQACWSAATRHCADASQSTSCSALTHPPKAPASPSTPHPQAAPARSSWPGSHLCWRLPGGCFHPVPNKRPDARFPREHLPGAHCWSKACPS